MFAERAAQTFLAELDRPEDAQAETLLKSIRANGESEFGRRHDFDRIRTVRDFTRAVPIRDYEALRTDIDRIVRGESNVLTVEPVKRFFLTSGSTSEPKHVPVTASLIRDKSRAFGIYWSLVFRDHPNLKRGRIVTNFSDSGRPTTTPAGLPAGSESSFWAEATRATQRQEPLIPKEVVRIADPEERYYAIARVLLDANFHAIMALNPSTIAALFSTLERRADELLEQIAKVDRARADHLRALAEGDVRWPAHRIWPDLELAISWRSPMLAPYLRALERSLEGIAERDYLSMASEGVMAVPLQDRESGGAVAIGVHFYEFVPEEQHDRSEPDVLLPHQLEIGRTYVVVLTNSAGLYRYDIGDVVRVVRFEKRTPVIEFLHRAGRTCSFTGEKLTEAQVTLAAIDASKATGIALRSFTLIPALDGVLPHYRWLVEPEAEVPPERLKELLHSFETNLGRHNSEYRSKRGSLRLGAPELWSVAPGEYRAHALRRVEAGANEDQIKQVHLTRDATFFESFVIQERIGAD